jgi:hypothetical protein
MCDGHYAYRVIVDLRARCSLTHTANSVVLIVGPGIGIPWQSSVRIMHGRRELAGQFRIQNQAAL